MRADFPELDPRLRVNLIARLEQDGATPDGWSVSLSSAPVAPVPDELAPWLDGEELAVAGHLLEVAACLSGRFCRSAGRRAVRVDAGCDGRPTVSRHERDDVCAARGRRS